MRQQRYGLFKNLKLPKDLSVRLNFLQFNRAIRVSSLTTEASKTNIYN